MSEVELIESLKTAQHVRDLGLESLSLPATGDPLRNVNANRPAWALNLAKNPALRNEFEQLEVAVNEYNTAASQHKGEIVIKQGCELKDVLTQAKALQETGSPNEGDRSPNSSIQAGLQQFCKSSLHYATIMDTLAQRHPEWVSLAWVTIKLLLMVPIEYQRGPSLSL
ncbi:uncharacterized protein BDZ83DRAFT_652544 [Colletotrichum acutatum]|uniref:DUF7708 domain-containing protein n=1 Tax=Glomerella acutata TaxID=27357 RepID=A0AAD8ULX9_GLOAC|nr:uncharacterized protein BDZ83DRAFT_652544 [Colletotrichum acutatum]KAK1723968.1 hypothetical protein BDZ83DRAFT_652544 [Colletotrichum acutatum]